MHQAGQPREHHLKAEAGSRPQMSQVGLARRREMLGERIDTHSIHA